MFTKSKRSIFTIMTSAIVANVALAKVVEMVGFFA